MKIDEACAYCGGLSRKLLYRAVARGELRAARVGAGRNLVFADRWCDAYLEERALLDPRAALVNDRLSRPITDEGS